MRIITWNCQGAFRNKADHILRYKPDILIVQECECPDRLSFAAGTPIPTDAYWYGDNRHKGIGIFSYTGCKFSLLDVFNPGFRYILPLRVTGMGQPFILFAIWAMDNKENRAARYIGQVWRAIHHYEALLNEPVILAGDFNSNKIWDHKDRSGSHSDVVALLAGKNIHSVYHTHFNQPQGAEAHPTFFLYRNKKKPYHLDYCFASAGFYNKLQQVEVGLHKTWKWFSDHTPLIADFER